METFQSASHTLVDLGDGEPAMLIENSTTTETWSIIQMDLSNPALPVGGTHHVRMHVQMWRKSGGPVARLFLYLLDPANQGNAINVDVVGNDPNPTLTDEPTWYTLEGDIDFGSPGATLFEMRIGSGSDTSGTVSFYYRGVMVEIDPQTEVGTFIPATDSPTTRTDYTINPTLPSSSADEVEITLGYTPVAGASLDWTGMLSR